ncbi:MAG: Cys-tRNA(Pro) deacylase [Clostridia bacterium]|nr:Cys-tRNA(Pro) deacylase [Clostridia bacterium]
MAEVKTNAVRIVETHGAAYALHTYPCKEPLDGVTVAGKLGADVARVFKTLVTQGKSGAYFVFVIPAAKELDLKKAARSVGEKAVAMIPVKDINRVTGYVRGGCSPVGMKKPYVTRIDRSALAQERVFVSAGRLGQQMELSPEKLAEIAGAAFDDLTMA